MTASRRSSWSSVLLLLLLTSVGALLLAWGLWNRFTVAVLGAHLLAGGDRGAVWAGLAIVSGLGFVLLGITLPYLRSAKRK